MEKTLFDRQHLMDYSFYGILSGIFYSITVWLYLYDREFREGWLMYLGSAFFTLIIMLYIVKLWQEAGVQKPSKCIYAGHFAVLTGVVVSIILSVLLCSLYKPELSSAVNDLIHPGNQPSEDIVLFLPGIAVNFLAGSFISLLVGYAMKWNYSAKEKSVSL